ncbi:DUF1330 domain-containing protein [Rugosimonospora africana]|uniref:DUF1330 domain-containing protein n=1 Tax=Rugosimonospora africana TaxID=556532 RepID=A0A8J3QYP9_9ACTN|nr:DUF1330 domain-containing protein [Rugosimonospora africana]GIH19699.1 hypothetical protein Raf01_78710 [Rugosimonospora africana]
MAKGYWVTAYRSVSDPDKLAAYGALAGPAITAGGGRFLVRAPHATPHDAGLDQRTVVVEFDSLEAAKATHDSEAYQAALAVLGDAVERDFRIVEGVA